MKYLINGQSIYETATSELWKGDSKFDDFFKDSSILHYNFSASSPGFFYSEPYDKYRHNGKPLFAKKGCRPNYGGYKDIFYSGRTEYLIKFYNKEVRVCSENIPCQTDPEGKGVLITDASIDAKYVLAVFYGAGGAGAGGGTLQNGAGGANGGMVNCCIRLEHPAGGHWSENCLPFYVGAGGKGIYGNYDAAAGEDTGLYIDSDVGICAAGGDGARSGGVPGVARLTFCKGIPFVQQIDVFQGTSGMAPGESRESVLLSTTTYTSDPLQNNFNVVKGGENSYGKGGDGARGYIGQYWGQGGLAAGYNGGNSDSSGGGGGGAYKTFSGTTGGNGGDGLVRIYY